MPGFRLLTNPPFADGGFYNGEKEGEDDPFDILNSGSQEGLFTHITDAKHASNTQAMVFFGLRERAFNCLFAPAIDLFANRGSGKRISLIEKVLPNMSLHHPSGHTFAEARLSFGTLLTGFTVAEVLAVSPIFMGSFRHEANGKFAFEPSRAAISTGWFFILSVGWGIVFHPCPKGIRGRNVE